MAVGFAAGLVGMVSTILAVPLALFVNGLLSYMFVVVVTFASVPYASVALPTVSPLALIAMYAVLAFVVWRIPQPPEGERAGGVRG
jgi:hypothetical protein